LHSKHKEGQDLHDHDEEGWEFVPARVPDGISLRNFGIQVPIYATLSDIVVYSPYGATPAALALARRFRAAIKAKRIERMKAAGIDVDALEALDKEEELHSADEATTTSTVPPSSNDEANQQPSGIEAQSTEIISIPPASQEDLKAKLRESAASFVQYRVFVLDAKEDEMRKVFPHLMMKICGAGVPGAESTCKADAKARAKAAELNANAVATTHTSPSGAHTDGPDGHLVELGVVEEEERREKEKEKEMRVDMDMVVDMDMDVEGDGEGGAMDVDERVDRLPLREEDEDGVKGSESQSGQVDNLHLIPNTVDFALREKEEMRDLTKASEIISLHPELSVLSTPPATSGVETPKISTIATASKPSIEEPSARWDPRIGQVYLGNSGDVPLAPDVPSHFRHAASVPRDADEAARWDWAGLTRHLRGPNGLLKEYGADFDLESDDAQSSPQVRSDLPHDDPFNYTATNDPSNGFGYDICIECHDLAPFPTTAHMRAAEEHLGMLDVMWKERWERAWVAREERRIRKATEAAAGGDGAATPNIRITTPPPAPPRPPPHANAVIHLPFPSSPSNSQASMVAVIPVIRFIEKWIRPIAPPLPPSPPARPSTPPELKNLMMIGNEFHSFLRYHLG